MPKKKLFSNLTLFVVFLLTISNGVGINSLDVQKCEQYEWQCDNGKCIDNLRRCDNIDDCGDNSDEDECAEDICDTQIHFLCDNGECISREMVCDGSLDCFDYSDENHCNEGEECPETKHKCENSRCIPTMWICDGVKDCQDGGDENNCTKKNSCAEGYATCNDGTCIPSYLFCNGEQDCEHNENESRCGNMENFCLTERGYYLCLDKSKCLKGELVCDGKPHCDDNSDEGGKCDMACEDSKKFCAQECFRTPKGPKCKCKAGYKLQNDEHSCQDINECELETQVCDHFCENKNGSYNCSCAENYRLLEGANEDNATCRTEEPAMLLFSVGSAIYGKMLNKKEKWIVSDIPKSKPSSIAFDPKFEKVYWISDDREIYVKSLKGEEKPESFLFQGLDRPENLAVDWLGRNLYITELGGSILVCNLEIKDCFALIKDFSFPTSLQLDLEERYLYYTTVAADKIVKIGLDGKFSRIIIKENYIWPWGLALDYPTRRIFWAEAELDKIESSDFEGKNRKDFMIKDGSHGHSLAVWQDRIYWTDWRENSAKEIHSFRKRDGMVWESEFKDEKRKVHKIMIYHTSMFKSINNPCEDHLGKKCSHICLLSPTNPNGYVCACPKDMKLRSDNHFCEELENFVLTSDQSNIYRVPLKFYTSHLTTPEKLLALNSNNIVDMGYNPSNNEIYFADSKMESISKVSLENRKVQKVIENIRFPTSVAVDWLRDNLYWINGKHQTIEVSRTSGSYRKKIAKSILSPTEIALDVTKGYLYISGYSIHKCELDGSNCSSLFKSTSNLAKVISFHVDVTSEPRKIYWTNALTNGIESVDENGGSRITEYISPFNPDRVTVNKDYIIWTGKNINILFFVEKHHLPKKLRVTFLDISDISLLYRLPLTSVYSISNNTKAICFNNERKCQQLCFSKNELNMVCGCSQGLTLQSDGTTCSTQECSSTEWMCDNGECIFNFNRCDGSVDCSDGSDEKNCSVKCSEEEFQCKDGSCIENSFKCDGNRNCLDSSDEENCTKKECETTHSWQCESGECIYNLLRCDGRGHCQDRSDEKDCDKIVCQEDYRKCNNGRCIPLRFWCDGDKDCKTGEDEINCPCKLGEYMCKDGTCLDEVKLCKNETWCDNEEANLTCSIPVPAHSGCPLNFVSCDPLASDIKCIPLEGWCNKTIECPNKEDEKHCGCDEDKVKCSDEETCIYRIWICDNVKDCADGSDETGCFQLTKQEDQLEEYCSSGFKCEDDTCISNDKVCDGHNDCDTGIDESGDCDKCQFNNGGCQQICHNFPTKVKCSCKTGFKLSTDLISCEDINECENEDICQHYCGNLKGSYYCYCTEGYSLKKDGTSCMTDASHWNLIIVRNQETYYFYNENFWILHASKVVNPNHLSSETKYIYDPLYKKLIGVDGQNGIIYTESSGKWVKEIAGVYNVKDVAFDYINRNVYIVIPNTVYNRSSPKLESREMGSKIQVYNLDSKLLGELFVEPNKNITSLELSLKNSKMYTCDNNETNGKIVARNLDGSFFSMLVNEKIIYCSSLVIDEFKNRIYWIDEALNRIESVNLLGSERRKFQSKQIHGPKSLSLLNHHLLWFNADQNALVKCSIKDPNECSELSLNDKSDISILNIEKVYNFSPPNPCVSSPCPHLCVPSINIHQCICAVGYTYENDNCTLAIDPETGGIEGNCSASPCKFGTCVQLPFGLVTCKCSDGYEGTLCEIALEGGK